MKAVGARLPRYDGSGARHRPDDVRRRRRVSQARCGRRRCARRCTTPTSRASTRRRPRPCRVSTQSSPGRTCRSCPTVTCPRSASPRTSRCWPRTTCATRASRSPSSPPVDEETAMAAVDAIDVDFSEKPALFDIRLAVRSRRSRHPPVGQLVSALRERDGRPPDPQGRHRLGLRPGRRHRAGRLPAGRDRALPARDAGLPGRARAGRAADDLHVHAGALLLDGRRRRAPRRCR